MTVKLGPAARDFVRANRHLTPKMLVAALDEQGVRVTPETVRNVLQGRTWCRPPKSRHASKNVGDANGRSKLSDTRVSEMRALYRAGEGPSVLAARFGVTRSVAQNAIYGRSWAHVPDPVTVAEVQAPRGSEDLARMEGAI